VADNLVLEPRDVDTVKISPNRIERILKNQIKRVKYRRVNKIGEFEDDGKR
jgi:hypothetical protein